MKIRIICKEEIDKNINEILTKAEEGIIKEDDILFMTPEQAAEIFTTKKLELLHYVAKNPHVSISEIAKTLNRDWKSVIRDLKYLEGLGLVELAKEGRHRIVDLVSNEQVMAFT